MKPWREHPDDPWAEAERLEVHDICRRMGWTKRRLSAELDRVASPEAFLERVRRALSDLDAPRLLHRDPARGYTRIAQEAAQGEPEAVSEAVQEQISDEANSRAASEARRINGERKTLPLARRLAEIERDARNRSINIAQGLKGIERVIERLERRVDRV